MRKVETDEMPVVDVDGSFLYKKYIKLSESSKEVAFPSIPSPPVSVWTAVTAHNFQEFADSIPHVSQGNFFCLYVYLLLSYATG